MSNRSTVYYRFGRLLLALGFVPLACDGASHAPNSSSAGGAPNTRSSTMDPLFDGDVNSNSEDDAGEAGDAGTSVQRCVAGPAEDGFVDVPVTDPGIRYAGRVVKATGSVTFAFPAVQIETLFDGDAIDLKLRDHGASTAPGANYYWVIIDGVKKKLRVCPSRTVYPLARNLPKGAHTLTIVKRTESGPGGQANTGKGEFLGFRVHPGTALSTVPKPTRLMEFVGDSIACGYGNEVSTTTPDNYPFTAVNEDAYEAYGAITARAFEADYVAVAVSGRGLLRNYSGFSGTLVPAIYEMTLPEDSTVPAWDHATYSPDVVVVNVGTNDFSPGLTPDQLDAFRENFRSGYIDFLARIRQVHATASIVAVVGPMMSDSYPAGYNAWTSIQADVKAAVDARRSAGDNDVTYFALAPQVGPWGEDWHPTVATHHKMAEQLEPLIANIRGW